MTEESRQWIEAFKQFDQHANPQIKCPACSEVFLTVKDVPFTNDSKIERWLICESCGKWSAAIQSKKQVWCKALVE